MKLLSLRRTTLGVLSISLGALILLLGGTNPAVADETPAKQDTPAAAGAPLADAGHPNMQSVESLTRFVEMRRKRDAAIHKASAIAKRKATPLSNNQFKQVRGGMKLGKYEAWLDRMRVRAYPNDRVDGASYLTAMKKQAALPAAQIIDSQPALVGSGLRGAAASPAVASPMAVGQVLIPTRGAKWEFMGPRNMKSPFDGYFGPVGTQLNGRVNGIAYDPKNVNTAYLAAAQGGVWKSVNGGRDWYPLSGAFPMLATTAVAVHPGNTQILLAGLGDHHGGDNFGNISGIMRSVDGGRSWLSAGEVMAGPAAVSAIEFDPDTPNDVIAATGGGLFRFGARGGLFYSSDAGRTWKASTFDKPLPTANGIDFRDVKIGARRTDGKRYYYAVNGAFVKDIYRSEDKGKTWRTIAAPIDGTPYGIEVAPSAVDPNVVYVADAQSKKVQKGTVNTLGGIDWVDITGNIKSNVSVDTNAWDQAFYDFYARAVPQMVDGKIVDALYVGIITVNSSLGGTATWNDVTLAYTGNDTIHVDQQSFAFNPLNPNEMLLGNDGGVFGAAYNPATKRWSFRTELSKSLGITQFYTADWHPTDPLLALGASQDNANPALLGNSQAWRSVGYGDGMSCAINPTNPNIMYTCSQFGAVFRTGDGFATNGGNGIIPPYATNEYRPFVTVSAIDPTAPHPYYVGTQYLWRFNESSQTWEPRLGGTELANGAGRQSVKCISIAPSDPNRIYVGTTDARLWVSADKGATWRKISDGRLGGAPLPNRTISAISVHPTNPNDIVVTLSGTGSSHIFRSVNAGSATPTFVSLSGTGETALPDNPANCVERVPDRPTTDFFVGTDIGVFYTSNGGVSWQNASAPLGLPNIEITALKATPGTGYLNVATYGRGMWRLSLRKVAETRR